MAVGHSPAPKRAFDYASSKAVLVPLTGSLRGFAEHEDIRCVDRIHL
ncbi:hypothetical protein ACFWNT_42215 [Streptomyces sp. NPDC058409]